MPSANKGSVSKIYDTACPSMFPLIQVYSGLFWCGTCDHASDVKVIVLSPVHRSAQACDEVELNLIGDLKTQIKDKENVFFDMEAYLPKKNGCVNIFTPKAQCLNPAKLTFSFNVLRLYLNLVLGNVNVTLLSNQAKYVELLTFNPTGSQGEEALVWCQLCSAPLDSPTRTNMKSSNFTWR